MKHILTTHFRGTEQLREDEYFEATKGLVYCLRCGTARQLRIEVSGEVIKPRCMCACQAEAHEQREEERRHREFLRVVERNRTVGLPDPGVWEYTFENDLGYNPKQMEIAKKYVDNWDTCYRNGLGLIFWGDTGTGKSYLAGAIANALLDQGVQVLVTNFVRLVNHLTDMYAGDRNSYIDSLNAYQLLIIDDLGVERKSDFAQEQVYNVIDSRYRSQMPLIITTNLTLKEMKNPADVSKARIYKRVLERCTPVKVNDQDIRKMHAAANMQLVKSLLEG